MSIAIKTIAKCPYAEFGTLSAVILSVYVLNVVAPPKRRSLVFRSGRRGRSDAVDNSH